MQMEDADKYDQQHATRYRSGFGSTGVVVVGTSPTVSRRYDTISTADLE